MVNSTTIYVIPSVADAAFKVSHIDVFRSKGMDPNSIARWTTIMMAYSHL